MHANHLVFCLPHTCREVVASLCRGCGMGGLQDSRQSLHTRAAVHWDLHVQGKSLMLAVLSFGAAWLRGLQLRVTWTSLVVTLLSVLCRSAPR